MSESAPPLRCPKCDGRMREVERRGIVIDICGDCRGVFLDRGELDTLIEAVEGMNTWHGQQTWQDIPGAPARPASPPAWQDSPPAGPQTGPAPSQPGQWQGQSGPSSPAPGQWQRQNNPNSPAPGPWQGQNNPSSPAPGPWQGQPGGPRGWQGQPGPSALPPEPWQGEHRAPGQPKKPLEDAVSLFRSLAGEHKRHKHGSPPRRSHRKGGLADFFDF